MKTITVFLADDHGVVRDGLCHLLGAHDDIKVIGTAADGRETLNLVTQLRPDVVVMDVAMPELNGIEATERICDVCPSVQVVVLSMYDTIEHIFRALQAGAQGYLLKESAGSEVVDAVRTVYAGHRYLSQKISDKVVEDYVRQHRPDGLKNPLGRLSPRERQVLQLLIEGKSRAEIASFLALSPKTIDTYRSRLMQKLGIEDTASLVMFAIQQGLTPLE